MFEELGSGFTLLDLGAADGVSAKIARAAEERGVPLKLIKEDSEEIREFYQAKLFLVRPDQFVAWVSDGVVKDPAAIVRGAVGDIRMDSRA